MATYELNTSAWETGTSWDSLSSRHVIVFDSMGNAMNVISGSDYDELAGLGKVPQFHVTRTKPLFRITKTRFSKIPKGPVLRHAFYSGLE